MDERARSPVEVEQPTVIRDVAVELDAVEDPELSRTFSDDVVEWAAPHPGESITSGSLALETSEGLHEQERILLRLESSYGQELEAHPTSRAPADLRRRHVLARRTRWW